jgi:membrane-associated phospholipid phosphatase
MGLVRLRCSSIVLALSASAKLASAQLDTAFMHRPVFTWRDAVLASGFVVGTMAIHPLDKRAADMLQTPSRQQNRMLKSAATTLRTIAVPGAVLIGTGMYATGRVANNQRLAELGLYGTEALFVGEGVGTVLKDLFGRARPFVDSQPNPDNWQLFRGLRTGSRYQSFPSGHTVAAFAAAAAVTSEVSRWSPGALWAVAPAMYGGATFVGLARMYENRHWASDVIMGAAIGTFAGTKVVRYHRTHSNNPVDRWLLNASISPTNPSKISFSILPLFQ